MFTVYILFSSTHDRYYIGQTNDIENRLIRHNSGYVKSTKAYKPWEMVYTEKFESRAEAMNRERYLKSMKSREYIEKVVEAAR